MDRGTSEPVVLVKHLVGNPEWSKRFWTTWKTNCFGQEPIIHAFLVGDESGTLRDCDYTEDQAEEILTKNARALGIDPPGGRMASEAQVEQLEALWAALEKHKLWKAVEYQEVSGGAAHVTEELTRWEVTSLIKKLKKELAEKRGGTMGWRAGD